MNKRCGKLPLNRKAQGKKFESKHDQNEPYNRKPLHYLR